MNYPGDIKMKTGSIIKLRRGQRQDFTNFFYRVQPETKFLVLAHIEKDEKEYELLKVIDKLESNMTRSSYHSNLYYRINSYNYHRIIRVEEIEYEKDE
jgi:hypothetical protein